MAGVPLKLITLSLFGIIGFPGVLGAHVKVSLYYEVYCPHSIRFICNHLYPTIQLLGGVDNEYLEAEFIPYGKSTTMIVHGDYSFDCQHGPQECAGNKAHSCALAKLSRAESTAFVNCSMALFGSPVTDPLCAASLNLNYSIIEDCSNSWEANTLLAANGIKTRQLRPKLRALPRINFNDIWSKQDSQKAQRDLLGLLCDKLIKAGVTPPDVCKNKIKE